MKITLNLSLQASARDRYALAWTIPTTVAALAVLFLLGRASRQEYRDYRDIQIQVAEVQKRAEELRNQEAAARRKLEYPAYRETLRQAGFVNDLIAQRQLSMSDLSARLAGLLPPDAHLTGLQLSSPKKPEDDYMVRMGITARGEDPVETFINDLEDSPDFKDVAIINQGFQEESSQGQMVNLICTARYLPGAEKEAEEATPEPVAESKKPEAAGKKPPASSLKPEGAARKPDIAKPKAAGASPNNKDPNQKVGSLGAEKPTPNR